MPRRYWYVIFTYVIGLFSVNIGAPILLFFGAPRDVLALTGIWSLISFPIMLLLTLYFLRPDMKSSATRNRTDIGMIVLWTIIGFFLVLIAQTIAGNIEINIFGVRPDSENTANLVEIASYMPLFIVITAIIAPILEEVVFRKIIFGSIYQKYGSFFLSIVISSLLFGLLHMEPEHLLRYTAAGLVFAFLYVKTKRILVPILTHISVNSFVFIIQFLVPPEEMEKILEQYEQMQSIIGGFIFL
ncbi:CPBP family intramembrane glutamic endopeptidase [Salirhabdus sp. Marseille-P4669]|uniref:CPBP family intramembrane glutamic endopeptidase n=1 Tax=Salirhabdus sp. Marseille-P4669 TaxID=2042310 RepID=UPI000C7BB6D0|nr:type II CAAX endopeptidase family protein [Salirhabdus sp. Marseille-P4669]